jgi:hypothetical protein
MRPVLLIALASVTLLPARAQAQFLFGLESGSRKLQHDNGVEQTSYYGGATIGFTLFSSTKATSGVVLPLTFNFQLGNNGLMELGSNLDLSIRQGRLAFGIGGEARSPSFGTIPDAAGLDGEVQGIDYVWFGYGVFGKLSFGPAGRMFVQGRYSSYPAGGAADIIGFLAQNTCVQATGEFCSFEGLAKARASYDGRIAVGYTFSNGGAAKILRLQYSRQEWRYDREKENLNGAFSRRGTQISLALVLAM